MKKTSPKGFKHGVLNFFACCAGLGLVSAAPESQIYPSHEIHHYAANQGASTVTVEVPHHYSFRDGKYVWIPTYSAEAPLPRDKHTAAFWISRTPNEPGHWSSRPGNSGR